MTTEKDESSDASGSQKIIPAVSSTQLILSEDTIISVVKELSTKKTFRNACSKLADLCDSEMKEFIQAPRLLESLIQQAGARCFTVLQTRFSMLVHWRSGLDFFLSLQFLLESLEANCKADLSLPLDLRAIIEKGLPDVTKWTSVALQEVDEDEREKVANEKIARKQEEAKDGNEGWEFRPVSFEEFLARNGIRLITEDQQNPKRAAPNEKDELRIVPVLEEGLTCGICLEDLVVGKKAKKMPECGHLFHDACIMEALEHNKTCPMCRNDPLQGARIFTTDDERRAENRTEAREKMFA